MTRDGHPFDGTWDEIVKKMRDANTTFAGRSVNDFMMNEARRGFSLTGVRNSRAGAFLSRLLIRFLEAVRLAPPGTRTVHDVLRLAQWSLVEGGQKHIFTPSFFWIARKPELRAA